jgi:hypothetical protein
MSKLILLSVLFAMVAIPTLAASDPDAKRGLKRTLLRTAGFFACYAVVLKFFWSPGD